MSDRTSLPGYDTWLSREPEHIPLPDEKSCEVDGEDIDTHGGEHYWHCGRPGVIVVDGTLMCTGHAGELGHGPEQEEYGFDPGDGLNPDLTGREK